MKLVHTYSALHPRVPSTICICACSYSYPGQPASWPFVLSRWGVLALNYFYRHNELRAWLIGSFIFKRMGQAFSSKFQTSCSLKSLIPKSAPKTCTRGWLSSVACFKIRAKEDLAEANQFFRTACGDIGARPCQQELIPYRWTIRGSSVDVPYLSTSWAALFMQKVSVWGTLFIVSPWRVHQLRCR